jgi:sugar/nucleoside kinase (ribokinase family)
MLKYEVVEMAKYDLVGIGNALVDVLAPVDDSFLEGQGLDKGAMTLVDTDRAAAIYDKMPPGQEISGGSCGNTMAGFASLGGRGAFTSFGTICRPSASILKHRRRVKAPRPVPVWC